MRIYLYAALLLLSSGSLLAQERNFQLGIIGSSQLSYLNSNQGNANTGSALLFGFGGLA